MTESVKLRIRRRAADWAKSKLDFEGAHGEEPRTKQFTLRLPIEDVAFADAIARRFGVSRNEAMGIFIASGAADAYEQLPKAERAEIVNQVEGAIERPVRVEWLRRLRLSEREDAEIPPEERERMRHEP